MSTLAPSLENFCGRPCLTSVVLDAYRTKNNLPEEQRDCFKQTDQTNRGEENCDLPSR